MTRMHRSIADLPGVPLIVLGAFVLGACGGDTGVPAPGKSSGRIAFTKDGKVTVADVDGSGEVTLADGFSPAWSPDGRRIAFLHQSPGSRPRLNVLDDDGSRTPLTGDRSYVDAFSWSPGGMKIAYSAALGGHRNLYVVDADGSERTRLTASGTDDHAPAFSPDGKRIAFLRGRAVYAMNADGSDTTRIAVGAFEGPSWSPDGKRIAFQGTVSPRNAREVI